MLGERAEALQWLERAIADFETLQMESHLTHAIRMRDML
jgi:hypothetical protein